MTTTTAVAADSSSSPARLPPPPPPQGAAADSPASEPHDALFLVMSRLRLCDLLAFQRVCKAFRDAVANDPLLWRDLAVEPPLSWRLTDDLLWEITSRAAGKMTSLRLRSCWRLTDDGVQRVVDANPCISKLYLPGCIKITGDGVVRMVRSLSHHLRQLRVEGIPTVKNQHFEVLKNLLQKNHTSQIRKPLSYNQWHFQDFYENDNLVDVDVCPKCCNVGLVFDCASGSCRSREDPVCACRACITCIQRCKECGICLGLTNNFGEETACNHTFCLDCWLPLPKCKTCNRPYCGQHMSLLNLPDAFECQECLLMCISDE